MPQVLMLQNNIHSTWNLRLLIRILIQAAAVLIYFGASKTSLPSIYLWSLAELERAGLNILSVRTLLSFIPGFLTVLLGSEAMEPYTTFLLPGF